MYIVYCIQVPRMLLTRPPKVEGGSIGESQQKKRKLSGGEELLKSFLHVHESMGSTSATPLRYLTFLRTYEKVYSTKKLNLEAKQKHLQVPVTLLSRHNL